jgi:hypothetical protein
MTTTETAQPRVGGDALGSRMGCRSSIRIGRKGAARARQGFDTSRRIVRLGRCESCRHVIL